MGYDQLAYHNVIRFSTPDSDNSCAAEMQNKRLDGGTMGIIANIFLFTEMQIHPKDCNS